MNLETEISQSVELLKKGNILLYPTDTIWGIGCDATNSKSVQKIYKLKGRRESKGMIVLLDNVDKLSKYVNEVPPIAYDLIAKTKTPLTIVYSGAKNLAKNIVAEDGSIAIRVVRDDYCSDIIRLLDKPIASTSANYSDQPTASTFGEIVKGIKDGVDHVVTVFQDRMQSVKSSRIIKLENDGTFTVLRA